MAASQNRQIAWTDRSRIRYAVLWGGLTALIVVALTAIFGSLSGTDLVVFAIVAVLLSVVAQGLIWYPRKAQKVSARVR